MSFPAKAPEFITKATLIGSRRWTEQAISKFLGEPEKTTPTGRPGHPAHLYAIKRVQQVEASPEFARWLRLSAVRKEAAHAGIARRRNDPTAGEPSE